MKVKLITAEQVKASGLFDADWYATRYPDIAMAGMDPFNHFMTVGVMLDRQPSPLFDPIGYLTAYPDVANAGLSAIEHYLMAGRAEGRAPTFGRIDPPAFDFNLFETEQGETPSTSSQSPSVELDARERFCVFVSGEDVDRPAFFYRCERYAAAARRLGLPALAIHRSQVEANREAITTARFVFIWRATWRPDIQKLIELARSNNVPVIFDLDDLMVRQDLVDPKYIDALRFDNRKVEPVKELYQSITDTMLQADYCTASTEELAWQMRLKPGRKPTFVLPNGYSEHTYHVSRLHARQKPNDGLLRIGYASGSRTHQADFKLCAEAVAEVLRDNPNCRLVLFRRNTLVTLDLKEFPEFEGLERQIEWRAFVPHQRLPEEVARFDINLAPLEFGNPFVESKSELKFFEAAICDVPTIASPTGPFKRAIQNGVTGFLASNMEEWRASLRNLVADANLRRTVARAAHHSALWPFGPTNRVENLASVIDQIEGGRRGVRAFHHQISEALRAPSLVPLVERDVVYSTAKAEMPRVSVIIPLFNYEQYIIEALESVKSQTLDKIELIVVDDASTDSSQELVRQWMSRNSKRFSRCVLAQHRDNSGLGASRNTAFDLADTLYVMALDADNLLKPNCCETLLHAIETEGAAFAYPVIEKFGDDAGLMGVDALRPANFKPGSSIDAMAMISKEAWALVGGYATHRMGWQDFDFWAKLLDRGLYGAHPMEPLAKYRVHNSSMLRTATDKARNKEELNQWMEEQHPWLALIHGRSGYHTI